MRISDWSSDVCSSDLRPVEFGQRAFEQLVLEPGMFARETVEFAAFEHADKGIGQRLGADRRGDRKSVVWGKSVSVRVDIVGRRNIKKKQEHSVYKCSNN